MEIGAQFYTLRDYTQTLEDFSEAFKKVADIGYKYVQITGGCCQDPEWLKEQLDKNGLKCVLTHIPATKLIENPELVAKEHSVIECDNVGLGWYSFDEAKEETSFDNFFKTFTPVTEGLHKGGKYFMYHNHFQEFQKRDGKLIIEHIAERFAPEKLGFTLDTYWVQFAGGDPAYWLERLSGRVPCIHLKDYAVGQKMAVIGEGNINFDRVFQMAEKAGTKYMLVEQDDCYGENPFDCLRRSYEYLKSRGFE